MVRGLVRGRGGRAVGCSPPSTRLRRRPCHLTRRSSAAVEVTQRDGLATISVVGDGYLEAAARQVRRFCPWTWTLVVGRRRRSRPGHRLRPRAAARVASVRVPLPVRGAAWSVLSQRIRIVQATQLRSDLIHRHGDHWAFPAQRALRALDFDLPGRKTESLHAALRAVDPGRAMRSVQDVLGLGPFAAELVVLRGANAPDTPATQGAAPGRRDRRALRPGPNADGGLRGLAPLPHVGGGPAARAAWATHPRDRRDRRPPTSPKSDACLSTLAAGEP